MRVASSDWWASRKVVSVTATSFASRSERAKAAGASATSRSRDPGGSGASGSWGGLGRIGQGDVHVTKMTSPYFNVVLPMLGAIVTDRGGQLGHAAIVAREYGIPGIVGTRDATTTIRDGATVRADGSTGEVHVLG